VTTSGQKSSPATKRMCMPEIGETETPSAIEAVSTFGWKRYIRSEGTLIGMRRFGASVGVTAAFNLNLLARINRELDGDFMLSRFQHAAMYNSEERRIEMHLVSTGQLTVNIDKRELSVIFLKKETIWTENSYKYNPEVVVQMTKRSGFDC